MVSASQNCNCDEAAVKAALRKFFLANLGSHPLKDSADLFSLGLMSSLLVIRLVSYVQSEFGVVLSGEDLTIEHFRTVEALAELVTSKMV